MQRKLPKLEYRKVSEIPGALGALEYDELASLVEARLGGSDAGLPSTDVEEDPGDILLYAFRQGEPALKTHLREAVSQVLEKQLRALALEGAPFLDGPRALLDRAFFLVGMTGAREALPTVRKFLPFAESLDRLLVTRLLGTIASLGSEGDSALVPWLLEKAADPELCRIALQALFSIHRPSAAAALPDAARGLLSKGQDGAELLARTLALLMPPLSQAEQVEFFKQAELSLRRQYASEVAEVLVHAIELTPGLAPRAQRLAGFWRFKPVAVPKEVVHETRGAAPAQPALTPEVVGKHRRTPFEKKGIALAHIERVQGYIQQLESHKGPREQVLFKIEREMNYLAEFQGGQPEDAPYYSQTLATLADRLLEHNLLEHARVCIATARRVAPWDPYPVSLAIRLHSREGDLDRAGQVFEEAVAAGLADEVIYGSLLDAYGKAGNVEKAQEVFERAAGVELANVVMHNALLDAYGKARNVQKAQKVFDSAVAAGFANEVTYSSLLDAYSKAGNVEKAQELFDLAVVAGLADEVTYNSLLDAYGKAGNVEKAQEVFDQEVAAGFADEFTYGSLLDAYGKAGNVEMAQEVFERAVGAGLANVVTHDALLDAYGKAGNVEKAQEVFDLAVEAGFANEVTYSSLLDAYGKAGNVEMAQNVFDQAVAAALANEVTYCALLDACARARKSDRLLVYFGKMLDAGFKLSAHGKIVTATTVLKGLAYAGRSEEAFHVIPEDFFGDETLFFYSMRHPDPDVALRRLDAFGQRGLAGQFVCRFRSARREKQAMAVQIVLGNLRDVLRYPGGLSPFTLTQLTATQSHCYRLLEEWQDMYDAWSGITTETLPLGPRITFLSGHGRDSITWARQNHKAAGTQQRLLVEGMQEVLQGLALEQSSSFSLQDAGITVAYGGVISALKEVQDGISLLPLSKRENVVSALRSRARVWDWRQPLEDLPEVAPDEHAEVRAGRFALLQMVGLAA